MLIYLVRNKITGMAYVGQTTRDLRLRWAHHKCSSKISGTFMYLHRDMRKFGIACFEIFPIDDSAKNLTDLNRLEKYWINFLGTLSPKGYNLSKGSGNGVRRSGWKHRPETLAKMSASAKGRVFSETHRLNLSLSHRGKRQPQSLTTREKIRQKKIIRDDALRVLGLPVKYGNRRKRTIQ